MSARLNPVHPGEILTEEFLGPLGITKNQLSLKLGIPASRIDQIAKGRRAITADTAFRLSIYFGTSPEFWLNLQSAYDLKKDAAKLPEIRRQVQGRASHSDLNHHPIMRRRTPRRFRSTP